jgi:ribonuclease G
VTVQVIKDPIGTKGARLSTQISIAGRMLVYLPQDKHIGISQRIENEAERERLRGKVQALLPAEEKGGFIVRTMAEDASDADLQMDIEYLRKTWAAITRQPRPARRPCCTRTCWRSACCATSSTRPPPSRSTRARTSRCCSSSARSTRPRCCPS